MEQVLQLQGTTDCQSQVWVLRLHGRRGCISQDGEAQERGSYSWQPGVGGEAHSGCLPRDHRLLQCGGRHRCQGEVFHCRVLSLRVLQPSKAWRKRKPRKAANALEGWQGIIPPSRTSSMANIQAYVAYVIPRLQEALALHGTHQQRGQRWYCHIRKQSYLHVMAKRLAGGRPKDKVCSVCKRAGLRTLQTANGERPHAVRVCIHCPTIWNRNTNAARNTLRPLKCLAAGKDCPGALRRLARRGKGGAVPELDVLQAVADGLAEAAAVEDAVNTLVMGCEAPYDSDLLHSCTWLQHFLL